MRIGRTTLKENAAIGFLRTQFHRLRRKVRLGVSRESKQTKRDESGDPHRRTTISCCCRSFTTLLAGHTPRHRTFG